MIFTMQDKIMGSRGKSNVCAFKTVCRLIYSLYIHAKGFNGNICRGRRHNGCLLGITAEQAVPTRSKLPAYSLTAGAAKSACNACNAQNNTRRLEYKRFL